MKPSLSSCGPESTFTLGQMIPYLRQRLAFTAADRFGAMVAHQEMARMSLSLNSVSGMDVLIQPEIGGSHGDMHLALDELRKEFPDKRIEVHDSTGLPSLIDKRRYVFPIDGPSFLKLGAMRRTVSCGRFPVSVLIHAVPGLLQIDSCILAILFSEPYDVLIATSEQARIALENTVTAAAEVLGAATGVARRMSIVKIPLCVDTGFIKESHPKAARQLLGLGPDDIVLLYLGRLSSSYKGDLEPLMRVVALLHQQTPNLKLVLAGRDSEQSYSDELIQMANGLGIRGSVTVLPNFPYFLKPTLLCSADIFVSPVDNIQESFGLSIVEAMAAGLPVVASDWSGYRDIVVHGQTGLLVDTYWDATSAVNVSRLALLPQSGIAERLLSEATVVSSRSLYQSLESLVGNGELRQAFGESGRRRAETLFSIGAVAPQYDALWKEQWDEIDRQPPGSRAGSSVDLNTVFRHFASHQTSDEMLLVCSSSGREVLTSGKPYPYRLPRGLEWHALSSLLEQCASTSRTFAELQTRPSSRQGILWLLKKGLLETGDGLHDGSFGLDGKVK